MAKKGQWIITLVIIGIGIITAWFLWQKKIIPWRIKPGDSAGQSVSSTEGGQMEEPAIQGLPVKVFRVAKTDYQDIIQAMGNIKGFREIEIKFEAQGVLKSFNLSEGERVKEGSVVAELDPRDYEQRVQYAETKLKSAQAELAKKQKEYQMYKELYDMDAIIKLKLEQVALEYQQARLELEAKQRELDFAKTELDKASFKAPYDCVVGSQLVDPGSLILTNTKVGTLIDAKTAIAEVGVVEREIQKLSIGQRANLYVDAYPGTIFSGEITSIQPVVAEKSRTIIAKITVDNPDEHLLSGMFTRVEIVIFDKKEVMVIPRVAIEEEDGKYQVYIVDPRDNKAKIREVEAGYMTDEYTEITKGLSPDDLVILNVEEVSPDITVQVIEEETLGI